MRNPFYSILTWVSIHLIVHTPKNLLCLASTQPECDATSETCSNSDVRDEIIESRDIDSLWNQVKDDHTNELRKLFTDCVDNHEKCGQWEEQGECVNNPHYMTVHCRKSCGECNEYDVDMGVYQTIGGQEAPETFEIYKKSVLYKKNEIVAKPEKHKFNVQSTCVNQHELCAFWAAIGECTANPSYMKLQCGPSCRTCDLIDINNRCPLDPNAKDALEPGDLNKMFEDITDIYGPFKEYVPLVYSHPSGINTSRIQYAIDDPIKNGPWIIEFEKFSTDEEADRLVELGEELGYERSTDVGEIHADGSYGAKTSKSRTSTNAWCVDKCYEDPLAKSVYTRISTVTGTPEVNQENLQLLHYDVGQYYNSHHDYIPSQRQRQCGPRILTFFLYLNDVEEGGETKFNDLKVSDGGLVVKPKKGKALLWPSVINEDPEQMEYRTHHQAMPVIKGVKVAANAWIHLRDFKTPNEISCT